MIWDPATKVEEASRAAALHILETTVKPRITAQTVEEHRARPLGRHSSDLEVVLRYLRRDLVKDVPRYVIVSEVPYELYCIGEHSRVAGNPITLTAECFNTEEEAQHAVFLRRLRALNDADVNRVLERSV